MKKALFLMLMLLLSIAAFAQMLNEGFDATSFPPIGWTTSPIAWERSTTYFVSTPASARCGYGSGTYWLITPRLRPAVGANTLQFSYRDHSDSSAWDYANEYTYVYLSTSLNTSTFTTLLWSGSYLNFTTTWQEASIDLSAYNGQDIYLAFKHIATGGNYRFIDNVRGVNLTPPSPPNPAINPNPASPGSNIAINTSLSWTSGGGNPTSYLVYFGTDNPPTNLVNGLEQTATTYTPSSMLNPNTMYYWQIIPKNTNGLATGCPIWSFQTGTHLQYAPSGATSTADDDIGQFVLGSFANPETPPSPLTGNPSSINTYSDFTGLGPIPLSIGQATPISVTQINSGSFYPCYLKVFIDYNKNGTFDLPGELVFEGSTSGGNNPLTGSITVPSTALTGTTRLRAVLRETTNPALVLPTGTYTWGETEDYTVEIQEPPSEPTFVINPTSWDFGQILVNSVSSKVFTISNVGGAPLVVESITIAGSEFFTLTAVPNLPYEVGPLAQTQFSVRYNPFTGGDHSAIVTIVDDLARSVHYVNVNGSCFDPTVYDLPRIFTFSNLAMDTLGWIETFSSGSTALWSVNPSASAGGTAPEYRHHYGTNKTSPQWNRLTSPPIQVSGINDIFVKWRHYMSWDSVYNSIPLEFRFQYSHDGINFADLWSVIGSANIPAEEKTFPLQMNGANTLYLSWLTVGNSYNMNSWHLDNIKILLENTEINQVQATGPTATVVVPPIIVDGNPVSPAVSFDGLSGNPIITVSAAYEPGALPNAGLALTIDGGDLNGVTMTFTHGLGFTPLQLAYRIGTGDYVIVNNPGTWDDFSATIVITGGKGPFTVKIVFPKDDTSTLPVELSSFAATLTADMFVNVAWVAASETDHLGYNVLRSEDNTLANAVQLNQNVITSAAGVAVGTQISYSYLDSEVQNGTTYFYWLESMDLGGTSSMHGPVSVLVNGEPGDPGTPPLPPTVTKLMSAYPNPFNPSTNIRYTLKEPGKVRIEIYNVKGQMIRAFDNNHASAGYYQVMWDGKDASGRAVSSGLYLYRMISGHYRESKKMVLAK